MKKKIIILVVFLLSCITLPFARTLVSDGKLKISKASSNTSDRAYLVNDTFTGAESVINPIVSPLITAAKPDKNTTSNDGSINQTDIHDYLFYRNKVDLMVENFVANENDFTTKEYEGTSNDGEYQLFETAHYDVKKNLVHFRLENFGIEDAKFDYIDYYYDRDSLFYYVRESNGSEHILWDFPKPAKSHILSLDVENEVIAEEDSSAIAYRLFYSSLHL